jgi:hypothetical protein
MAGIANYFFAPVGCCDNAKYEHSKYRDNLHPTQPNDLFIANFYVRFRTANCL